MYRDHLTTHTKNWGAMGFTRQNKYNIMQTVEACDTCEKAKP